MRQNSTGHRHQRAGRTERSVFAAKYLDRSATEHASRVYNHLMHERELMNELQREGFANAYVSEDTAHARHPDHTHRTETAHIILSGELTLTMSGGSKRYRTGEQCDVPANAVHSAQIGPKGCRYLIAER
jgi:mannose-6-phosphate isomerase-like protein (cupin superfamily)